MTAVVIAFASLAAVLSGGLIWAAFTAVRATRDMGTADGDKLQAERNQKDAEDERDDAIAARAQMEVERDNARALARAAQESRNAGAKEEVEHAREAVANAGPGAAGAALDDLLRAPLLPPAAAPTAGAGHGGATAGGLPAAGPAAADPAGRRPG